MSLEKEHLLNRQVQFIYLMMFLLSLALLTVFVLRDKATDELNNRVQQLGYARQDFDAGVLHILLAGTDISAWQTELGTERFRQALQSLNELGLRYASDNSQIAELLDEIKVGFSQLLAENPQDKVRLSESILSCRMKFEKLDSYFRTRIIHEKGKNRVWFNATVFTAIILVICLLISLYRNDRKRALYQKQLYDSQYYLSLIADNINEVFWLKNAQTNELLYLSSTFETLWQLPVSDVQANPDIWLQRVHADDKKTVLEAIDQSNLDSVSVDFRIVLSDGEIKWVRNRLTPVTTIMDSDEVIKLIIVIESDITQTKLLNDKLNVAQKLESLGKLTGGIAHDFNNLLTVIMGNAQLIKDAVPAHAQLAELIIKAAERGASLNRQLLAFASQQQLQPERINMSLLIPDTLALLRSVVGKDIEINFSESEPNICCLADTGQLQNAIINLCLNAREAMPDGGEISVELAISGKSNFVKLIISDNGQGIADDILPHIFEPFFTTKSDVKGTGLGLSMVYGFVKQSGGEIHVASCLNHGSTFTLFLPLCPVNFTNEKYIASGRQTSKERVLIVEDDPLVRKSILQMLEGADYSVTAVEHANTALELLTKEPSVNILVSDVRMPGPIDGIQLANIVRNKFPETKILLMSGYVCNVKHKDADFADFAFLAKPFCKKQLTDMLVKLSDHTDDVML